MKHAYTCFTGKLFAFLCLFTMSSQLAFPQDFKEQRQVELQRLDLKGLGNTLFLNNAIISREEVDFYKSLKSNSLQQSPSTTTEEWEHLYERLTDADIRPPSQRLPDLHSLIESAQKKRNQNNVVPIGIMDLESIYLTDKELDANREQKRQGKRVDFTKYKKLRLVTAAALQEDIYQAEVKFRISPDCIISNHSNKIDSIGIDFQDGKGYHTHPVSQTLIPHRFTQTGKHEISVRFKTNGAIYSFRLMVNVLDLERIKPFKELHVSASRVTTDTAHQERAARTMVVGAEMRIILGCDQIFDKPIIIAEGFDIGQNVGLDELQGKYRVLFDQYLAHSYDLVFVNYDDGRAAMQDNAQVLKAVIDQVNTIKQGNHENILIGESMSGLIARFALRQMETNGQVHHVSLLICYDTPHQGANVPVGLVSLLHEANPTLLTEVILKFFTKKWREFYLAMGTPAARQLLLHQTGLPNLGNKHPDFDAFRNSLTALGNGGYPQNCRNIAITHGSMDASDRTRFDDYNYGSRILRSWTPFLLQNTNIEAYTNALNQLESVLKFAAWGIFFKAIGINRKYSSTLNDDFLPGGVSSFGVPNKLINATKLFDFCFVPTFSAIDYQGPRATQNDRELLDVGAVDAVTGPGRQTPFAAIYGAVDSLQNSFHVSASVVDWNQIGIAEGLIQGGGTCPALPLPPIPTIASLSTCYPFSDNRQTEGNTANITVSLVTPSNGQYIHEWTVLPTQQTFTTTGDQITFQAERAGSYQVICNRTYPNRRDLQSTHNVSVAVSDCNGGIIIPDPQLVVDSDVDVNDIWENDFLLTTPKPDSQAVFAHYYSLQPLKLYAATQNGTFVPRTSLIAYGMFEAFAVVFEQTDPQIPLPVKLTQFTVRAEGNTSILSWSTEAEINTDRFEIQRSTDGNEWTLLENVAAHNRPDEAMEYRFTDHSPPAGLVYYRLKMIDADETFAYSRIQTVQFEQADMVAYPNPVEATDLHVLIRDRQVKALALYNMAGKLVYQSTGPSQQIDMRGLTSGRYILTVSLEDGTVRNYRVTKR